MKFNPVYLFLLILLISFVFCSKPVKQDGPMQESSKPLKQNSPLDEQKKQKSKEMMEEVYAQLKVIPEMNNFMNIVNHSKNNHVFVNAEKQGYIIAAVTDKGFRSIPVTEKNKLTDTSGTYNNYQLKFLLHHIISNPRRTYPGMLYRSLAGDEVSISESRSHLSCKDKSYRIQSSHKVSEDLEIMALDSILYY